MPEHSRFDRMVVVHMDSAYRLAVSIVRNAADAEDVVQEAYLRAYKAFDRFVGDDARPWLLTIVRNTALQRLSHRRNSSKVISLDEAFGSGKNGALAEIDIPAEEPSVEALMIAGNDRDLVIQALDELTTAFREIILLREFEEMSYLEISGIIGVPPGTVMSRLARARAELKRVLMRKMANG